MKRKIIFLFLLMFPVLHFEASAQEQIHAFSLKECISYGLEHHISTQIAQNEVESARQSTKERMSAYLPQVNISAGVNDNVKLQQTIIPKGIFGPDSPEQRIAFGTQYSSTMTAQLDQKVYDQSLLMGIRAVKSQEEIARMESSKNQEEIIYNIASSYYQILILQKQTELLRANLSHFEEILKITNLQAELGAAKKIDVKQVQVNLNNVKAQLSGARNNLFTASNTLKNYMGLGLEDSIRLTDSDRWLDKSPDIAPYPDFDYSRTFDSKIQQIKLDLRGLNSRSIKAQALPVLSVFAQYGANGFGNKLSGAFKPLLDYSGIGVKITWNVFSGLGRTAQYKSSVLDLENATKQYELNKSVQNLQFLNARSKSNEARTMIFTNKENMEVAEEVYNNTTLQYKKGATTLTDLLNAELSYKDAQNNYINSLLDYYQADLGVQKANGNLLHYYKTL